MGNVLLDAVEAAGRSLRLFGRSAGELPHAPRKLGEIVRQVYFCGLGSLPVVSITAIFTGMVVAGQTGTELARRALPTDVLGALVGASICRELGPVLTAVVVAGLVGGGFASILGTMSVNEEVDALRVMSIPPERYLVMPRLIAMGIAMPVLVGYADILGILGGAVVAKYQVGVTYHVYFDMLKYVSEVKDILFGTFKGLVFGLILTTISCDQGLAARGGAEGVGRATMRAVVYSFLMILVANYLLFSLVYRPTM